MSSQTKLDNERRANFKAALVQNTSYFLDLYYSSNNPEKPSGVDFRTEVMNNKVYMINDIMLVHTAINPRFVYYQCTFVFNFPFANVTTKGQPLTSFKARAFINCKFIFNKSVPRNSINITCDERFVDDSRDLSNTMYSRDLIEDENTETGVRLNRRFVYEYMLTLDYKVVDISRAALAIATKRYPMYVNEKLREIVYNSKRTYLRKDAVAAGVELEIPVDSGLTVCEQIDGRLWFKDEDGSQLEGNLEVVSKPMTLARLTSKKMQSHISRLYNLLKPPSEISAWKSLTNSTSNGSGMHMHFSWDVNELGFSSVELENAMHTIVESLGGEKWLIQVGGKQLKNFKEYSPFCSRRDCVDGKKYRWVHLLNTYRIEMRWCANDPDVGVVTSRINAMCDLFMQAAALAKSEKQ